jgi:hypothetical protein
MVIQANDNGRLVVFDESTCPGCRARNGLCDTGCAAPGCPGWSCPECGWGCDLDVVDDGDCARALDAEPEEDRQARIDAQRAAFGLPPLH